MGNCIKIKEKPIKNPHNQTLIKKGQLIRLEGNE